MRRYEVFPIVVDQQGHFNVKEEVLTDIWSQMVEEKKAQKVFYNGYITSVYDFINFLKSGAVLPILIGDNQTKNLCHIVWISDYGDGHASIHHCSLGDFKRGAGKAGIKYYGDFKDKEGEPLFNVLIGITPENNEAAVRVAKVLGFKILSPSVPGLCNDVYSGQKVPGVVSYYQYNRNGKGG